jgi:heme A synthase
MSVTAFPAPFSAPAPPRVAAARTMRLARIYFSILAAAGLAAFILGVTNRFTSGGLFGFPPPVDWLPPLSAERWARAYAVHQQDPIYAACGGTESLAEYQLLYGWEWLRQASLAFLGLVGGAGLLGAVTLRRFRFALPRMTVLAALALAYAAAILALEFALRHVADLGRYNVGQYRHALEIATASAALAAVLLSVVWPPLPASASRLPRRLDRFAWVWLGALLTDIGFGALFAARDAAAVWTSPLGYEGGALPPWPQLVSYSPFWLNFTVNPYAIQLIHRGLSTALWAAALAWLVWCLRRKPARRRGAVWLFALLSAQMAAGIGTLALGLPAALSIVHQIGAVLLIAASVICLSSPRRQGLRLIGASQAPAHAREIVTEPRRARP